MAERDDDDQPGGPPVAENPFADDPPVARAVRKVDLAIGLAEQVTLFALLAFLVVAAFAWFVLGVLKEPRAFGLLKDPIDGVGLDIRYSVFLSAMVGGAFATHHRRLLSMDLVSRLVSARTRAWLRVALNAFAITMASLFFYYGLLIREQVMGERHLSHWIPPQLAASAIALGAGLIVIHLVAQTIIDLDYLVRGKTPPEPEQGVA